MTGQWWHSAVVESFGKQQEIILKLLFFIKYLFSLDKPVNHDYIISVISIFKLYVWFFFHWYTNIYKLLYIYTGQQVLMRTWERVLSFISWFVPNLQKVELFSSPVLSGNSYVQSGWALPLAAFQFRMAIEIVCTSKNMESFPPINIIVFHMTLQFYVTNFCSYACDFLFQYF